MLPIPHNLIALAAATSTGSMPPEATRRGWAMFALVAMLGLTLVGCASMLALLSARRRRRSKQRPVRPADPRDPWQESAKRMVELEGTDPNDQ